LSKEGCFCSIGQGTTNHGPTIFRLREVALAAQIEVWGNMRDDEWIKKLEDGRKVKFTYQELPEDGAFITAQIERNEVVYSVVLAKARNLLSHEDVESHFKGELEKK
jgi:hypothetical protein